MNFVNFPNGYRPNENDFLKIQTNPSNHLQDLGNAVGEGIIRGFAAVYASGSLTIGKGSAIDSEGRRLVLDEDLVVNLSSLPRPSASAYHWVSVVFLYQLEDVGERFPDVGDAQWAERVEGAAISFVTGAEFPESFAATRPEIAAPLFVVCDVLLGDDGDPLFFDQQRMKKTASLRQNNNLGDLISPVDALFNLGLTYTAIADTLSSTDIPDNNYDPSLTALSPTSLAFYDSGQISFFTKQKTIWNKKGTGTLINTNTVTRIAALNDTDIAMLLPSLEELRTYRWDGVAWEQVGSSLDITTNLNAGITALSDTEIIHISTGNPSVLQTYRWDGVAWEQVGLSVFVDDVIAPSIAMLNENTIALINEGSDELQTYRRDGFTWVKKGFPYSFDEIFRAVVVALNEKTVVVFHCNDLSLKIFYENGDSWVLQGRTFELSQNIASMSAVSGTDIVLVDTFLNQLKDLRWTFTTRPPAPPFAF